MKNMKKEYPSWFERFEKNLSEYFKDSNSKGIKLISSQRPSTAFTELTTDQFSQYVFDSFQNILINI
jgi:hypothetical protein